MRRRVWIGSGIGVAVIMGIGVLVWANQQGLFGPYGKARRLLALARQAIARDELPAAQARLEELIGTFPNSPWTDHGLLMLGRVYETQQQVAEAREIYRLLLDEFPSSPLIAETQQQLGQVNVQLLFSPFVTDMDTVYDVTPGDTLSDIAATHGTTVELIQRANQLKGDLIYPGQSLKVPGGRFSVVVDKSQNQLLLTADDQFIKTYAVATGANGSTPVGSFKIINKLIDPIWYRHGAVVPPDSPENILGTRWLGIDATGYGIHGTTDPDAIGQSVTAGCVRMNNADVEELYAILPLGTEVTIVD